MNEELPGEGRHFVYSLYAPDHRHPGECHLIYVGVTSNLRMRLRRHARKWWWPLIDMDLCAFEEAPTRSDADRIEARTIFTENPIMNVVRPMHDPRSAPLRWTR